MLIWLILLAGKDSLNLCVRLNYLLVPILSTLVHIVLQSGQSYPFWIVFAFSESHIGHFIKPFHQWFEAHFDIQYNLYFESKF